MRHRQEDSQFMITEDLIQAIVDALDVAAKDYPIKALAGEIYKNESTLRGELNGQLGHKLGLITALLILARTGDLSALDLAEEMFGRVAFPIPRHANGDPAPLMTLAGRLAKEFGEHVAALGAAMMNSTVDADEARECLRELDDVIKVSVELRAHLEHLAEGGR